MKSRQYKIICFNVVFILVLAPLCPGQSLLDDEQLRNQQSNRHKDWVGGELINKKDVSFSSSANEKSTSAATAAPKSFVYVKETVKGLQAADCSLSEIVTNLKNNGNNASEISIACLNNNFGGAEIHAALIGAGFTQEAADNAVPAGLRQKTQTIDNLAKEVAANPGGYGTMIKAALAKAQEVGAGNPQVTETQTSTPQQGSFKEALEKTIASRPITLQGDLTGVAPKTFKELLVEKAKEAKDEDVAKVEDFKVVRLVDDGSWRNKLTRILLTKAGYKVEDLTKAELDDGGFLKKIAEDVAKAVPDGGGFLSKLISNAFINDTISQILKQAQANMADTI